jgi:hypothetical protein
MNPSEPRLILIGDMILNVNHIVFAKKISRIADDDHRLFIKMRDSQFDITAKSKEELDVFFLRILGGEP